MPRSSRGLGHRPFTAKTRVRNPSGVFFFFQNCKFRSPGEMVDTLVLGTSGLCLGGSSPSIRKQPHLQPKKHRNCILISLVLYTLPFVLIFFIDVSSCSKT